MVTVASTCICCVGVLTNFSKKFNEPAENLSRERAEAIKAGIPLTLSDLAPPKAPADADNAAFLYPAVAVTCAGRATLLRAGVGFSGLGLQD